MSWKSFSVIFFNPFKQISGWWSLVIKHCFPLTTYDCHPNLHSVLHNLQYTSLSFLHVMISLCTWCLEIFCLDCGLYSHPAVMYTWNIMENITQTCYSIQEDKTVMNCRAGCITQTITLFQVIMGKDSDSRWVLFSQ